LFLFAALLAHTQLMALNIPRFRKVRSSLAALLHCSVQL
jgi:hypothetical protein